MARHIPTLILLVTLLLSAPAVAVTYAEVWSVDGDLFTVGDADNDGKDEIVVLPCDVYSCSAAGCKRDYSCGASASDVWSVAVGDGDGDGNNEIYLGKTGGFSVYRCDNSRCVEAGQGETLYNGRAVGFAAGDVNNDGTNILMVGTNPVKECGAGRVTGTCTDGTKSWGLLISYTCDADGCVDQWFYEMKGTVDDIDIVDVDNDGENEVLAARNVLACDNNRCDKTNDGSSVDPEDIQDGDFLGTYTAVGDLDGDGKSELVTRSETNLYVYSCDTSSCERMSVETPASSAFDVGTLNESHPSLLSGNATDSSLVESIIVDGKLSSSPLYISSGGAGATQLKVVHSNGDRMVAVRLGTKVRLFAARLDLDESCERDNQCGSGICAGGVCSDGSYGAVCEAANDCDSGNCLNDICCESGKECCLEDNQCSKGVCDVGSYACHVRAEGDICTQDAECDTVTCTNGVCCTVGKACCTKDDQCAEGEVCCAAGECKPIYDVVKIYPPNSTAVAPGTEIFVTGDSGGPPREGAVCYTAALEPGQTYQLAWSFPEGLGITAEDSSISRLKGPDAAVINLDWKVVGDGELTADFTVLEAGDWDLVMSALGNGVGYKYTFSATEATTGLVPTPEAVVQETTPEPEAAATEATPEPTADARVENPPAVTPAPEAIAAAPPAATPTPAPATPAQSPPATGITSALGDTTTLLVAGCLLLALLFTYLKRAPIARAVDGSVMGITVADAENPAGFDSLKLSVYRTYTTSIRPSISHFLEGAAATTDADVVPAAASAGAAVPATLQDSGSPYSRQAVSQAVRYETIDRKELMEKLKTLKELLDNGLITPDDYNRKKEEYLARF